MVLNEFVAFVDLGKVKAALDPRSFVIATFALCGFANLSSIAIQIGGIGGLAPSRKSDLAKLGFKAMIVGTRSEEHTSELQSHVNLVCRLLLEKKKKNSDRNRHSKADVGKPRSHRPATDADGTH